MCVPSVTYDRRTVASFFKKGIGIIFRNDSVHRHHPMSTFDEDTLKKLQDSPTDKFGITHKNILYNEDEDKIFCILNAPDKEAVEKHHNHAGLKCEWIKEVKSTA